MKYSIQELRLLSFVVRCFDSGQFSASAASEGSESDSDSIADPIKRHVKDGAYCIILTQAQISAIEDLNARLADSAYNSKNLFDAMDTLAEALYMPQNSDEMMADIFVSPVVAMICLAALTAEGGFRPPKSIVGDLVGLQFGIRLCIFFVVMKRWRQRKQARGQAPEGDGDWFQ